MDVGVLGPLRVDDGRLRLGSRDRIVLEALVVREVLSPEELADAVWGDQPPPTWRKSLQGCVSRLRRNLGHDVVLTSPQGYRLDLPLDAVDAWQFERLTARAQELLTLKESERARFTVTQGLDLWRGRPLTELEEWSPGAQEAARLSELRLGAEELQLDASLASGHHREVLAGAQAMVEAAPVRERRWTLLALAQYQSGRQAEALRTLHRLRRMMAEELGLDPAPDAVALEQAILRQDPSLQVEEAERAESDQSPYVGLRPYDESDAESYFGRDEEVARCLERLADQGVLAVVGPSGSGKSSLVRAGVATALRAEGRGVVVVTPGRRPMDALTGPLGRGRRPVLVVDQAEEVFTLCTDPGERGEFLDRLCEYAETAWVALALRADRTGDVASHLGFTRLVERGLFLLGAMSADSLRSAVQEPARQAGLVVEPGLVDLVVREVEGEPGALPLLSHTLRETWLRREGRALTVAGYRASGGVRGAVSQSAERLYAGVPEEERGRLKELMLRLVAPGAQGEPVRARMPRRLVAADRVQEHLVDQLVTARLVTSDAGVVEIAHESLVSAWPRLRAWLDEDVEGRRVLHHLVATADAWDTLGRPESELYRGVRLSATLAWRDAHQPELTDVERDFLAAGAAAAAAEERAAADRARQQSRMIRRLSVTAAGAGVLLVLALVAGFIAVRQTRTAEATATTSDARRVGALALVTDDIDKALLLAVAGFRLDDTPETRSSLLATLGKHPALVASTQMEGAIVSRFDVSPDGRTVATVDLKHKVRLYDLRTNELLADFQAGRDTPLNWISGDLQFSPDGKAIAVHMAAPARQPVILLDAATLEPLPSQPGGFQPRRWHTQDLGFSADGHFLAATMYRVLGHQETTHEGPGRAFVWDLAAPRHPVRVIRLKVDGWESMALSPDGQLLYVTDPLAAYDVTTGRRVLIDSPELVYQLALSPDGRLLAGTTVDGSAFLIDTETHEARRLDSSGSPFLVEFSADGARVAVVDFAVLEAIVWDVATGDVVERVPLAANGEPFAFAPDGSALYTAGNDAALRKWDLDGRNRYLAQVSFGEPGDTEDMWTSVAPGGAYVVHQTEDVSFLDVASGNQTPARSKTNNPGGSWHPDGVHYASAGDDGVTVWDARSGQVVAERRPPGSAVTSLDYSTDGSRLAVVNASGALLLDPATLSRVGKPVRLDGVPCAVSLGPDNHTAVVLTGPPERLWPFWRPPCGRWVQVDLRSGTVLQERQLPVAAGRLVDFSPDGRHAAIGGDAGEVVVMDLRTGKPVRPPVAGHDGGPTTLSYSSDGRRILSSGLDSTVVLWDGPSGLLESRLVTPERFMTAGFLRDQSSVLIAYAFGGPAYRWDTSAESAADFACRAAGRDLTRAEWQDTFGDRPYEETCPGG